MKRISVLIPIYNEEGNIDNIKTKMDRYILSSQYQVSVIFVNDGSIDGSMKLIENICLLDQTYSYISFSKNFGLSAAIKAGIDHSDSEWIGYIDGDLQTNPMDFLKFESFIDDFELVTGFRQERKDTKVKKLSSYYANWFRQSMLKDGVRDSGCPLKIIRTDFAKKLPFYKGMHRFLPALVKIQGGRVKEIPVSHFPRTEGHSKFHLWNRMFHPFLDTLFVYWMKKRRVIYQVKEASPITVNTTHE